MRATTTILAPLQRFMGTRRWIRTGIRHRLSKCPPQGQFEVPFAGYRWRGNFSDYIDRYVYFFGGYEIEELEFLRPYLKDKLALDIGANTGQHALFFSRDAQEVHAFDPHMPSVKVMERHIADNGIKNIIVHPIGLGAEDSKREFYSAEGGTGKSSSFVPTHSAKNTLVGRVPVRNGDYYLTEKGIRRVGFIKLDVEGFEDQVLAGLQETIKRDKPVIWMEWLPQNRHKELLSDYRAYGFDYNRNTLIFFNNPRVRLVPLTPDYRGRNILLLPN